MTRRDKPHIHDISTEEADKRMASAGSIPFSLEEVDAMVRSATADLHIVSENQSPSRSPDMSPDMRDETEDFWRELMNKVSEADSAPDLTMAEAEERMASAEEAAPLSDEEVASTVSSATEESSSHLRVLEADPAPVRRNFFLRHSSTLTRAAALFLGIVVLYSVVGRDITFPGPEIRPAIETAVDTLINESAETKDRLSAIGEVADHALSAIRVLKDAQQLQSGDVQADAQRYVEELRFVLETSEGYESPELTMPMEELKETILDVTKPLQQRLEALRILADQARGGILLLKHIQGETPESELGAASQLFLKIAKAELF